MKDENYHYTNEVAHISITDITVVLKCSWYNIPMKMIKMIDYNRSI